MDIIHLLQAFFLGLVQGLSEFLPISSSGHLTLIPWMFGWETPGMIFDTSLHLGTALALAVYFYNDFVEIIKGIISPSPNNESQRKLALYIILGMVPAGVIGLLFDKHIEALFMDPLGTSQVLIIITSLMFFGVLLWLADRTSSHAKDLDHLTWKNALVIGFSQILALFPGTSRSGITMTTGMFLGFSREAAARFSFLVGAPITFAAGVFKLKDLQHITFTPELILYFLIGFITSTVSGYLCIRFFLHYLKKHPVTVFTVYRLGFGLLALSVLLFTNSQ